MNFGQKFPYALLFSPSPKVCRSWLLVVHLIPTTCQADCSTHAHLLQKVVKADYWVHYTPIAPRPQKAYRQSSAQYTPYANLTTQYPHSAHHPHQLPYPIHQPYTNHTPAIHPPIPLLLRVDSDEMRQNRQVCGS